MLSRYDYGRSSREVETKEPPSLKVSVECAVTQNDKNKELISAYHERIKKLPWYMLTQKEKSLLKYIKNKELFNVPALDVDEAFRVAGANERGLPRLAIASYDSSINSKKIQLTMFDGGSAGFSYERITKPSDAYYTTKNGIFTNSRRYSDRASTDVPLIPPELRQKDTRNVFVLFEVAKWDEEPRPVDPYLLRKIDQNLFIILGTWDLTQFEIDTYQACRL